VKLFVQPVTLPRAVPVNYAAQPSLKQEPPSAQALRYRRILTFGDVLDESVRLYRQHFLTFAIVSAIALLPSGLVLAWATSSSVGSLARTSAAFQNGVVPTAGALTPVFEQLAGLAVVAFAVAFLFGLLYSAAIIVTSNTYIEGDQPALSRVFGTSVSRYFFLLVSSFLLFLGTGVLFALALILATITLGGIFGLVPLVALLFWWLRPTARRGWLKWLIVLTTPMGLPTYFGFRWAMYLAAIVLEHRGPVDALSRSAQLTAGQWFRVSTILFVAPLIVGVLVYVLNLIVQGLVGAVSAARPQLGADPTLTVISFGISLVLQILFQSVSLIVYTLLFHDLRNRREGTDIAERLSQLEAAPLPANG
jgi:hypothetical protein